MPISLLNGLSQMGSGIAAFAGTAGLEQQRADLARQSAILADQLATTRETALEGQRQQFQTGLEGQRQTFQAGQTAQTLAAEAARTAAEQSGATARTQMGIDAPSPEIKSAQQFAKLTPEEKQAYREEMMVKAGLPPWMIGTGGDNPAPPPAAGTGSISDTPPAPSADGTTPATTPPGTATPGGTSHNENALQGVPPAAASVIRGMVDGRISPPSSFALSKPYWQGMIAKAADYDPTFDQTTWAGRVATRKDFTAGKSAAAVTALNTALAHAGTLVGNFDALNNFRFTPANTVLNAVEPLFGDARQNTAQQTVDALASEARKVFAASGGGNLTELQEWQKSFPLNGSPNQQHKALTNFVELLDGRLQALSDQYNRGMGRTDDPINLLQPKARAVYEKLTGREPENATGYQTGQTPATAATPATPATPKPPAIGEVQQGYSFMGGNPADPNSWQPVHQ